MDSSDDEPKSKPKGKSRRELPTGAVATLKAWLLSPEHFTHPYPTPQDQILLMQKTGIDKKQLKNWFTNARRRIWKPMLKKQLEAGKLAATSGVSAGGGGGGLLQGGVNNQEQVVSSSQPPPPPPTQEMYNNYQQATTTVTQGSDDYEYGQQQPQYQDNGGYGYDSQQQQYQQQQQQQSEQFPNCNSIGSLAPLNPNGLSSISSFGRMFKTNSHAVLMELFARDQDLVKQASGQKGGMIQAAAVGNNIASVGGGIGVGGMTNGISSASMAREINKEMNNATNAAGSLLSSAAAASSTSTMGNLRSTYNNTTSSSPQQQRVSFGDTNQSSTVPSLSSWPHFSSVSSLNNMGNGMGLKGVKSITNLSAADLSSQGNLNKMGNLAHVKSIENMGRGDSFAFLEVFFDDKSGLGSSSSNAGGGSGQRGIKREREEDDNAIGLTLDDDDGTSPDTKPPAAAAPQPNPAIPTPAPLPENGVDIAGEGGEGENSENLKRAYDDALAARGLIAVRRSCEKLTDLDLPNKMQRTLSQEYIRQHNQGQPMGDFFSSNNSSFAPNRSPQAAQQFPPQQQAAINTSVEVPSSTKCALCSHVNVDTQLRPCGHMFHGRCLKPSLSGGPPKCPICNVPMESAILAFSSDNNAGSVAMGPTSEGNSLMGETT